MSTNGGIFIQSHHVLQDAIGINRLFNKKADLI
jgi:hypothetical protein